MTGGPTSGSRARLPVSAPPSFPAPPALEAKIRAAIAETPAVRTPLRTRIALAAAAPPLAAAVVLFLRHALRGTSLVRIDFASLFTASFAVRLVGLLVLTIAITRIALRPGRSGLGSRIEWLIGAACVAGPAYALTTLIAPPAATDAASCAVVSGLSPFGVPCAIVAVAVGALSLAALAMALRGAVPTARRMRGAAIGAAAGLWAGFALFVHCPAHDWRHLVFGHVLPVLAFALVGALGVDRVLRP